MWLQNLSWKRIRFRQFLHLNVHSSKRYTYTLILKVVTITLMLGFTYNIILFLIMLLKKLPEAILSATETCKITFPLFLFLETKYI